MAVKVYVVYYSMYGHVAKLAEEIQKGVSSVEGVEAKIWQVPETLPEEVLGKMGAPPKPDVPIIIPQELAEADGILFGFPTRFGMMAAQMKAFFDATGGLWREQSLAGKPAGIFFSTGTQGGGQETTPLTTVTQLTHHGMVFVPVGYTFGAKLFDMEKVQGGSPYGAGTFASDGSRWPSEMELEHAFHQEHLRPTPPRSYSMLPLGGRTPVTLHYLAVPAASPPTDHPPHPHRDDAATAADEPRRRWCRDGRRGWTVDAPRAINLQAEIKRVPEMGSGSAASGAGADERAGDGDDGKQLQQKAAGDQAVAYPPWHTTVSAAGEVGHRHAVRADERHLRGSAFNSKRRRPSSSWP